jgi:ABC-type antimicrobial peptide transport system permease subunit
LFTSINILGLAIGISASLVIYLLVNYHFSFDMFEKDSDRVYRVVSNYNFSGEIIKNSGVCYPMADAVRRELTGLDAVIPLHTWDGDVKVSVPDGIKKESIVFKHQRNIVFADSNYFNLLRYEWLAGSQIASLKSPYQTVLTESNAKVYFPKLTAADIIGKKIYFNNNIPAIVTGVVKDITVNTDFTFKTFIAYSTLENTSLKPQGWEEWGSTDGAQQLFIKLSKGTAATQIERQIAQLFKKYNKQDPNDHDIEWHTLQPLRDMHFNADYSVYHNPVANKPTMYGLLSVAVFLIVLACINFINLTTAQATKRAKEIGIRKTMGGLRSQLITQFLGETFLLTFFASILSTVLTPFILKVFSGFIPEDLHFNLVTQPEIILFLFALMIAVTILAGFYPALILSGYKPVLVLKNQAYATTSKTRNAWLRKSLTLSQFVIAQIFIMVSILVSKQITYSVTKDQGFKKDAIVYFNTNWDDTVKNHRHVLMDKIRAIPEVAMISLCHAPPSSSSSSSTGIKYKDGKKEIETQVQLKYADTNYIKLYGLKLLAGTNIEQTDTITCYVINETYAHILGFQKPEQSVGKYLDFDDKLIPIKGVVADFNQSSLHEQIKPLAIASLSDRERNISIALQPQSEGDNTWKAAISKIQDAFKEVYPQDDFEYRFFDEDIAKYYTAEQNISSLLMWSTGLAIFISCLGLLGLVIYTTTQRTKEIGVRKVLGASIAQIVGMITKEFVLLVLFAFVIAAPIAWIGMNRWLENFAYRTDISWWIFLCGGATMVFISLFTLSFQTIKAAIASPVKSLRTE